MLAVNLMRSSTQPNDRWQSVVNRLSDFNLLHHAAWRQISTADTFPATVACSCVSQITTLQGTFLAKATVCTIRLRLLKMRWPWPDGILSLPRSPSPG